MLKDKLKIVLITYNRKNKLKRTLDAILAPNSPVRNFDITILDNASDDGTSELIEEYCPNFPNLKHIKHKINIGGNANICRAFEFGASSGKEYVWVLCDDDKYDFSNWNEVEKEINEKKDIICVSDYVFQNKYPKDNKACQIFQLTFVPAGIYRTDIITDSVLTNMYDSIYTLFQQSVLSINVINNNGKIKVLSKPIVFNGIDFEDKDEDMSLVRGYSETFLSPRQKTRTWILGFSNVITLLKDKTLQKDCMEVAIPYEGIYSCWENFYNYLCRVYVKPSKISYFFEIYNMLYSERRKEFAKKFLYKTNRVLTSTGLVITLFQKIISLIQEILGTNANKPTFIQNIFSVKNESDHRHKVLRILGFKLKFRRTI